MFWFVCCWFVFVFPLMAHAQNVYVHVFVHGTTMPGFLLLNQVEQKPLLLQNRYISFIEKSRQDERFYDDSLMLERGIVHVGKPLIDNCKACLLDSYLSRRAAVQAIAAYDDFVDHAHKHEYYVYGWSGLLSDNYRKQESEKLYNELLDIKKKIVTRDKKEPRFILHGHSHGGNIILYLGLQEEIHKSGLSIEHVLLYEMPVQIETAKYCLSPMFKNVSLLYSDGDFVQTADSFSTNGKSCKTFSELISLDNAPNRVQEILVKMNGSSNVLPHRSYFFFDAYYSLSNVHKNLFFKNGAIEFLNPLPLVVCGPVFVGLLQMVAPRIKVLKCELDIRVERNCAWIYVSAIDHEQRCSFNVRPIIEKIKERVAATWRPYAKTSDLKKLFWLWQHLILR